MPSGGCSRGVASYLLLLLHYHRTGSNGRWKWFIILRMTRSKKTVKMSIAHTLRCHFVLSKVQCGPSLAESVYRYYVNGNIILSTKNNNEIKISFANALFYTAPFTIPHTVSYQRAKTIPTNEYYITRRQHWLSPPLSFSYNHNRIPYNPIVWQCLWPIISVHNPIIIIISQYTITASTLHWSHLNPSIRPSVRSSLYSCEGTHSLVSQIFGTAHIK